MALAVAYMGRTGQQNDNLAARAKQYLSKGAQRLQSFEVAEEPGGFSLFGRAPARLDLSAYALMVFHDLARVEPDVDPTIEERIAKHLRSKRKQDGSYDGVFVQTAFVAWAFAQCGQDAAAERAWIEKHLDDAKGPYETSLAALAFLSHDPKSATGHALLRRLTDTAVQDTGGHSWDPATATLVGSRGRAAKVETTALAIQALLLGDAQENLTASALSQLVGWRKRNGTFGPTQGTLQALRALLAATPRPADAKATRIRVFSGESEVAQRELAAGRSEPLRIDLGQRTPAGLKIRLDSGARLRGTLSHSRWVPWKADRPGTGRVSLTVRYPDGDLEVGRRAYAEIEVRNPSDKVARIVTAEIGLPPGCDIHHRKVEGADQALAIERGTTTVVLYLDDIAPGKTLRFRLPFTPRYRIDVKTTPSKAYEYYCCRAGPCADALIASYSAGAAAPSSRSSPSDCFFFPPPPRKSLMP